MAKRGAGEGSLYYGADGRWHASVSLGSDPATGRRVRRHVQGSTRAEVSSKLARLRADASAGVQVDNATVGEWFDLWITISERNLKPSTLAGYRSHTRYVKGHFGKVKLSRLTTEQVEGLYDSLRERGLSGTSINNVHRTIRAALNEAVRRGRLAKNPAIHARPGRIEEREVVPITVGDAQSILAVARGRRNGARWPVALSLGLRQGEALGLCWEDVDWEAGTLRVRRVIQRVAWKHGCKNLSCGLKAHRCPRRHGGGLAIMEPKSRAGRRTISLPANLVSSLRDHRRIQLDERLAAGELWEPGPHGGWVFATVVGRSIQSRRDWGEWKEILRLAGVPDARLHDARHSAATYLLVQGVDPRTVMGILGWSQLSLTARYQHVVPELKQEAAERMDRLLWNDGPTTHGGLRGTEA
jgi:integrase